MKRRDKFIETERGMKVMKTWLMKNVTIMSNVFIKVRLCRSVCDSYAVGKHKIFVQSIAIFLCAPVCRWRCFTFMLSSIVSLYVLLLKHATVVRSSRNIALQQQQQQRQTLQAYFFFTTVCFLLLTLFIHAIFFRIV